MTMKKQIWLVAGIAGMLLGSPSAQAEVSLHIGIGDRPRFVLDTRPDFIYLPDRGFSVSIGSPYDIVYYGDRYYLYRDGGWYLASDYRGPWILVRDHRLPYAIRRHRFNDIWRYRDMEYRRHDRVYWDDLNRRYDRHYRIERDRRGDYRHDGVRDWRGDDRRDGGRDWRGDDRRDGGRDDRRDDRRDGAGVRRVMATVMVAVVRRVTAIVVMAVAVHRVMVVVAATAEGDKKTVVESARSTTYFKMNTTL